MPTRGQKKNITVTAVHVLYLPKARAGGITNLEYLLAAKLDLEKERWEGTLRVHTRMYARWHGSSYNNAMRASTDAVWRTMSNFLARVACI